MSIVGLNFFLFAGIVLAEYWLCLPKFRWMVLLAASTFFILSSTEYNIGLYAVFAAEVLLTWLAALSIPKIAGERFKTLLTAAVVLCLAAVLILYKDLSFFVNNINWLGSAAGAAFTLTLPQWAAPFGVSYFTLILIGYLLDVRWGTVEEPQRNPLKMLLFAGYFPQMTSGPFSRYGDISGALFGGAHGSLRKVGFGFQRLLWGLFKKLVVADRLAVAVAAIYDAQDTGYVGWMVVIGAFLYVAQLYTDFGGCMDIVMGVSELFGIQLAENFCRPFSAASLSEIWRRWHMTLGLWLKDYLLYPVLKSRWMGHIRKFCKQHWGRKAAADIPTYIGMFVTWFCVGFWHGGSWKYIFGSGLFFFVMIAGGQVLKPVFKALLRVLRINTKAWSWRLFQRIRTACLFSASVSLGRRSDLMEGLRAWKTVFTTWNPGVLLDGTLLQLGLDGRDIAICGLGLAAVLVVSMLQEKHGSVRELLASQNLLFRWLLYILLILIVLTLGYGTDYSTTEFIYAGF